MSNPMVARQVRQICIGFSSAEEVEPGEMVTCTATVDRPGLVESLIFQSALVPMAEFSFMVEWMRPAEWKKMGDFWVGKLSEVREICGGRLLESRVQFADIPGCASALVKAGDLLHLTMVNSTAEKRRLFATAWLAELGPGFLETSTGGSGPWPSGHKSGDGE